jgi:hypothetical protein
MFKKDNLRFGFLLGFIGPILSLVVYYFIKFYPLYTVGDAYRYVSTNKTQITAICVPCLILNIALFTFYINTKRYKTSYGIFGITLLYAIITLVFKFIV